MVWPGVAEDVRWWGRRYREREGVGGLAFWYLPETVEGGGAEI